MNKKNLITLSLASAAVLGAGFVSQTQTVSANEVSVTNVSYTDGDIESLQNKVADLEKEVSNLEEQIKFATKGDVEDYYASELRQELDAKKAEFEKAQAELDKALDTISPEESDNGDVLTQPERPEFGANSTEIKKVLDEIAKVRQDIEDGEANGAEPYMIDGLKSHLDDLLEAFDTLTNNTPTTNEVPEFTGGVNGTEPAVNEVPEFTGGVNDAEPTVNDVPAFDVASLTQQQQDRTYQAPAANDTNSQNDKPVGKLVELPNTGEASGAGLASMGALTMLFGLAPFLKRKKG